jgi:signal transduction histidine kinase
MEGMTTLQTAPMSPPAAPVATRDPRATLVGRVLLDSAYAVTAFAIALPAFVLAVTLLALGVGLVIIVGGIFILSLAAVVARGFAALERSRVRTMLGRPAASPAYLRPREGDGWLRTGLLPLRDPQSWLDLAWSLVGLVTGTIAFVVTVTWWAVMAGGLTYWFWQHWVPYDSADNTTLAELIGLGEGRGPEIVLNLVLGVVALVTLPAAVRLVSVGHAALAGALLSSRAELQREVERVEVGRAAARTAEAESLRRLERDIHDGPQQRLIRLSMDLGRARRMIDEDPARAGETLDAALVQARETVDELRSLSRGIAPPLLVDRGLAVALDELVTRSTVPVEARYALPDRLAPHVETATYFVVAEALTNVAKHSAAQRVQLDVAEVADAGRRGVAVRVEDDGVGGAHPAKGSGLAGLEQRLVAVDGSLDVQSPAGGPTVVTAWIPTGPA